MWHCTANFQEWDSEINIEGLPDYSVGESADVEGIAFYSDSEEES